MSESRTDEDEPRDVGEGYPEDASAGLGIDPSDHPEDDIDGDGAPETSRPQDGDPGKATGNPRAAGG